MFVVLTILPFAVIGFSLLTTVLIQKTLFLRIAFFSIFPMMILLGVNQLLFAKDAEDLYEFLRNKGGLWKWLIPTLPKKEKYLMNGVFLIILGTIFTLILILSFFLR